MTGKRETEKQHVRQEWVTLVEYLGGEKRKLLQDKAEIEQLRERVEQLEAEQDGGSSR